LRLHDAIDAELAIVEGWLCAEALERADVRRLMTIPGIGAITALGLVALIGDVVRFATPRQLVGYLGLDPRVRQSGERTHRTDHISRQGQAHVRSLLVEASLAGPATADRLFGGEYQWSILGAGRHQTRLVTVGAIVGGNVRVGLEDSAYLEKGVLAESNAAQVEKIVRILRELSLEPATPQDAREMLALKGRGRPGSRPARARCERGAEARRDARASEDLNAERAE
jgi:hypothetical protein